MTCDWRRWGKLEVCGLVAALLVGCTTVGSVGGMTDTDRTFIQAAISWDQDKDGQVTCAEWQAYAQELFMAADLDRDGRLTRAEFDRVSRDDKTFVIADFKYFDADGDGYVSRGEFVDRPNPAFKHLDQNNDCVLDTTELVAARALNRPTPSGPPMGKDKGGGPGGKGGGMPGGKGGM
jgi:EF hand